ncbi:hypothetical protein CPC08DRAFT_712829 [Agrocybe pediades]|nr:hypothetical protein CPC08DRAFT_712829 [Agrocybe pediades]
MSTTSDQVPDDPGTEAPLIVLPPRAPEPLNTKLIPIYCKAYDAFKFSDRDEDEDEDPNAKKPYFGIYIKRVGSKELAIETIKNLLKLYPMESIDLRCRVRYSPYPVEHGLSWFVFDSKIWDDIVDDMEFLVVLGDSNRVATEVAMECLWTF